jgi:hypothetical protein
MNGFGNYAICLRGNIPFYCSPCLALGTVLLAMNSTVVSDSTLPEGNWLYEAWFASGLQKSVYRRSQRKHLAFVGVQ